MIATLAHTSLWLVLPVLALVCYFQNMAFTMSSRSRNSGDPNFHRYAAWASNGVYILCHSTFLFLLYETFTSKNIPLMIATGIVYTLATTEGSVHMMKIMIAKTKGKAKVVTEEDLKKIYMQIEKLEPRNLVTVRSGDVEISGNAHELMSMIAAAKQHGVQA